MRVGEDTIHLHGSRRMANASRYDETECGTRMVVPSL